MQINLFFNINCIEQRRRREKPKLYCQGPQPQEQAYSVSEKDMTLEEAEEPETVDEQLSNQDKGKVLENEENSQGAFGQQNGLDSSIDERLQTPGNLVVVSLRMK